MAENTQQQQQQQQRQQRQQPQQQGQGQQLQQQMNPAQRLGQALAHIRRVQNMVELNYPGQGQAILMLREAGDLVWAEIQRMQQQAQQRQQGS